MRKSVTGSGERRIPTSGLATQSTGICPTDRRDIFHGGGRDVPCHIDILIVFVSFFLAQLILRRVHLLKRANAGIAGGIRMNLQDLENLVYPDPQSVDRRIVIIGFGPSVRSMSQDRKGERDGQKQGGHKATLDHDGMIRGK